MLECPTCHQLYEDRLTTCPNDGAQLIQPTDPRVGTVVDKYRIMGPISSGGMGTVYRGEHALIGKEVAIKVLRKEFQSHEQLVRRFLMEARAASMIRHPNIVDVFDFGVTMDGCSYCAMEYLEGPSLADVLDEQGALPLYRIVNILVQVTRALAACHEAGIVHRDLKPENIMVTPRQGRRQLVTLPMDNDDDLVLEREPFYDFVKILDFGVAQVQESTAALDEESRAQGVIFGSPDYISPEQALGHVVDHRTDIYSLGVILYEMLTGDVPFHGDTAQEVMLAHVRTPPSPPSDLRPDLDIPHEADKLVMEAMAKRPEHRISSMAQFLQGLKRCLGKTLYRRDLHRALSRYGDAVRPTPDSQTNDDTDAHKALRHEISNFFHESHKKPSRVSLDAIPDSEGEPTEDLAELKRLLTED